MLAVLFLGVGILIISMAQHIGVTADSNSSRYMVLHVNSSGLEWLEFSGSETEAIASVPAELTPFFFMPVPLNSAKKELLTTLPGIGPGLAERIIDFRETHGVIRNTDDFMRIKGIGSKRNASLQHYVSFQ